MGGVDQFLDVGLSLQQIVDTILMRFVTSPADVFDDVAFQEPKVLVNNEVPNLNLAQLIMIR